MAPSGLPAVFHSRVHLFISLPFKHILEPPVIAYRLLIGKISFHYHLLSLRHLGHLGACAPFR